MRKDAKIFVAGHQGMVGSALIRHLKLVGFNNPITRTPQELNLIDQYAVSDFFKKEGPEYVFLAASKSGGIVTNERYPADFIYINLQIQNNVIHSSYKSGVKRLLFFGSSCIYPRGCPQPMKEEYWLSGELEKTSEPYAIAKIAGIKMCQSYSQQYGVSYISLIPATIYGPKDDFDLEKSHVLSSLIRKFHEAKINNEEKVIVWGTGRPRREFLYVDDLARACIFLIDEYHNPEIINVGYGKDLTIKELALLIRDIVGFKGDIIFDRSKPDGTLRKLLDNSKITKLGWKAEISLEEGIRRTYKWYEGGLTR